MKNTPCISMIAALDERRGIGRNNALLWHIPDDMKRFKQLTIGHPIIMGRKTFESIGRPLPKRTNIVVTRNPNLKIDGVFVCNSMNAALTKAREIENKEIFIIGGAEIYKQGIKYSAKLYLTIVKAVYEADAFFPDFSEYKKVTFTLKKRWNDIEYMYMNLEK